MIYDKLIQDATEQVKWHERQVQEWTIKLDAYYTARDARADALKGRTDGRA